MYYSFSTSNDEANTSAVIDENESLDELKKSLREYYKQKAMDDDAPYWEIDGFIFTHNQFGDLMNVSHYYACANMPVRSN